uniref:Speckle-type POZ protein B n=1 Tax=Lygus hesperus TaxID=30085 RepID=A0A0A9YEP1_LYGHE
MSGSEDLWGNYSLADVWVVSGPVQKKAHSSILFTSSVVLQEELKKRIRWDEKPWKITIKIKNPPDQEDTTPPEIDEGSLERFLYFMYHRRIADWGSSATTLLRLGYTYKMEELMVLCEDQFLEKLSAGNAVACLILANACDRHALKRKVADYISTNMDSVMVSKNWKKLESNLKLLGEILVTTPSDRRKRQTINEKILDAPVTWEVDTRESKFTNKSCQY